MATLGWKADPVQNLSDAIKACEKQWGDDPSYKEISALLDQAWKKLDALHASPGRRAALAAYER